MLIGGAGDDVQASSGAWWKWPICSWFTKPKKTPSGVSTRRRLPKPSRAAAPPLGTARRVLLVSSLTGKGHRVVGHGQARRNGPSGWWRSATARRRHGTACRNSSSNSMHTNPSWHRWQSGEQGKLGPLRRPELSSLILRETVLWQRFRSLGYTWGLENPCFAPDFSRLQAQ